MQYENVPYLHGPVSVRTAKVAPIVAMPTWVARRIRRLGYRSASRPPVRPNINVGTNCRAVVMPTAVALPVRLSTNQVLRDALHPRPGVGHHLTGREEPEVAGAQ